MHAGLISSTVVLIVTEIPDRYPELKNGRLTEFLNYFYSIHVFSTVLAYPSEAFDALNGGKCLLTSLTGIPYTCGGKKLIIIFKARKKINGQMARP